MRRDDDFEPVPAKLHEMLDQASLGLLIAIGIAIGVVAATAVAVAEWLS